jgi:iron complex transport system substrate-binding protein
MEQGVAWRKWVGTMLSLLLCVAIATARTVRDELGRVVKLPSQIRRIVSLTPAATENLFALGAGHLVVGVCSACDYPPKVRRLPQVGDFAKPSLERLVALKPDLIVISSGTITAAIADDLQRRSHIPVFVLRPRTVAETLNGLLRLGEVVNRRETARRLVAQLRRRLEAVARQQRRLKKRPTVVVEIAPPPNLMVAGPHNYIDDAIRYAGGRNAFADAPQPFPVVSLEALVAKDPDVYLVATKRPPSEVLRELRGRSGFDQLRCVRDGRVFALDPDLLFRPTPRLVDGIERIARWLRATIPQR